MFRDDLLKDKRILITGGGTGLGKGMAERFLELGATVYICGRREEVLTATAAELKAGGVEFMQDPKKADWGTSAIFKDQDGNLFVLSTP